MEENRAKELFFAHFGATPNFLEPIGPHASSKLMYRIGYVAPPGETSSVVSPALVPFCQAIALCDSNKDDFNAFANLTEQFLQIGLPVPHLFQISKSENILLMEDLGGLTLYNMVKELSISSPYVISMYKEALSLLLKFQITGGEHIRNSTKVVINSFGSVEMMKDLRLFHDEFLYRALGKSVWDQLEEELVNDFFMYRDFQARNIVVGNHGKIGFVDYQGGCFGLLAYDVVSLLWQSRVSMPDSIKHQLLEYYLHELTGEYSINRNEFMSSYYETVLLRLMQVLGRYGRLGMFEGKALFLESIEPAINSAISVIESGLLSCTMEELAKKLVASRLKLFSR
jgi:N-acetylmuramate 1-kinase